MTAGQPPPLAPLPPAIPQLQQRRLAQVRGGDRADRSFKFSDLHASGSTSPLPPEPAGCRQLQRPASRLRWLFDPGLEARSTNLIWRWCRIQRQAWIDRLLPARARSSLICSIPKDPPATGEPMGAAPVRCAAGLACPGCNRPWLIRPSSARDRNLFCSRRPLRTSSASGCFLQRWIQIEAGLGLSRLEGRRNLAKQKSSSQRRGYFSGRSQRTTFQGIRSGKCC